MVRPLTTQLIEAVMRDEWPGYACQVDFGLDGWAGTDYQRCYEALYYPIRKREITAEQLDAAMGNGPRLTELARSCLHNPHKEIEFKTAYDDMTEEES